MTIRCPSCGKQNPPESLWCLYCNKKLKPRLDFEEEHEDTEEKRAQQRNADLFSKKINVNSEKKIAALLIPLIFVTPFILIYLHTYAPVDVHQIDVSLTDEFWFEDNTLYTEDGWTCSITLVQEYSVEGIILGLQTYSKSDTPYAPINIFSPIDFFMGFDNIKNNPDSYPLKITSGNRIFYWTYSGDNPQYASYVAGHVSNHHIIPHTQDVLDTMKNVSVSDVITLTGYLVNINAVRDTQCYHWNTDTTLGNSKCEIVLADSLEIQST